MGLIHLTDVSAAAWGFIFVLIGLLGAYIQDRYKEHRTSSFTSDNGYYSEHTTVHETPATNFGACMVAVGIIGIVCLAINGIIRHHASESVGMILLFITIVGVPTILVGWIVFRIICGIGRVVDSLLHPPKRR